DALHAGRTSDPDFRVRAVGARLADFFFFCVSPRESFQECGLRTAVRHVREILRMRFGPEDNSRVPADAMTSRIIDAAHAFSPGDPLSLLLHPKILRRDGRVGALFRLLAHIEEEQRKK